MKTRTVIWIVVTVILVSFGVSTFGSLVSVSELIEANSKEKSGLYVKQVESDIVGKFLESAAVSQTLNNPLLRELIANADDYSDDELADVFKAYLGEIKEKFGYDTAFAALECNLKNYSENGFSRDLIEGTVEDTWYFDLVNSDQDMVMNIDADKANNNRITIYNNYKMFDDNGNLIGACGVGRTLDNVNEDIKRYEKELSSSIYFADPSGIIMATGDVAKCGEKLDDDIVDYIVNYEKGLDYVYDRYGYYGFIDVMYIDSIDWYLVLTHEDTRLEMSSILFRSLRDSLISLIIMTIIIGAAFKFQEGETLSFKADSETDKMTGLLNRRAYETVIDSIAESGDTKDVSVFVVDVNGLKQTNDTKGHQAGDELIMGTAACLTEVLGNHGSIFRIGGDEFVKLLTEPVDLMSDTILRLKKSIADWSSEHDIELSVAIGAVKGEEHPDSDITELIKIADRNMYEDKELYYRDKRHNRRR